jgi:hypothetical protein
LPDAVGVHGLVQLGGGVFSIASYAPHAADWLREREHAVTENDSDEKVRITERRPEMADEIPF